MFALLSIAIIATCDGWGGSIHREITSIALRHLSSNKVAKKYLLDHLGGNDNIIRASTWADTNEAALAYPESEDLHFSNTPWRECAEFNMTRDCGFEGSGRCIVSGIADFAMVAIDHHQSLAKRVDALKFLLHLVGDIHQPLHTGFAEDNGGVNIQLTTNPVLSLHQMWDYGIWETSGLDQRSQALGYEPVDVTLSGRIQSRDPIIDFATALASESSSMLTCTYAYQDETGSFIRSKQTLSEEYLISRRAIIASRIELAGKRLANFISVIATSFSKNVAKPSRTAVITPLPTARLRSRNLFEVLPIEFEPDDYIEAVASSLSEDTSPPARVRRQPNTRPQTVVDEPENPLPLAEPETIGNTLLSDAILVKRRERYVVTCRSVLEKYAKSDDYEPFFVQHFRVRFSKNRKRTEPIVFLVDATCFDAYLSQQNFLKILYLLSGNDFRQIPESSGSIVSIHRGPQKDLLDIHPIRGEYVHRSNETGRIYRGWNPLYINDPAPVRAYLNFIQDWHYEDQIAQRQWAAAQNISITNKWDIDFYSKLRDIVVYRVGRLQVIIYRKTLTQNDLVELRSFMFGCVAKSRANFDDNRPATLGEDPAFTTLIDTNIFDGFVTERILKGITNLVRKALVPDPVWLSRPTLLGELSDVDSILHERGLFRTQNFNAIRGFYMIPSAVAPNVAYIEWTILPTVLQVTNQTDSDTNL